MNTSQQTAVEKALDARARQFRLYRASKRQQFDALCTGSPNGDLLRKFTATLGHFTKPGDADRFLEYVQREIAKWLGAESADIRFVALEQIDDRIQSIRLRARLAPIDDALPGEDPDAFNQCKRMLGL